MSEELENLKKQVDCLEKELEKVREELKENSRKDKVRNKRHHNELKQLTEKNHKESITWNKIQAFSTPVVATILVPILIAYLKKSNNSSERRCHCKKLVD